RSFTLGSAKAVWLENRPAILAIAAAVRDPRANNPRLMGPSRDARPLITAARPHFKAMTLRCRPRERGDPYAAARRCCRASDNRKPGGYGSPPSRGRQRVGLCQNI